MCAYLTLAVSTCCSPPCVSQVPLAVALTVANGWIRAVPVRAAMIVGHESIRQQILRAALSPHSAGADRSSGDSSSSGGRGDGFWAQQCLVPLVDTMGGGGAADVAFAAEIVREVTGAAVLALDPAIDPDAAADVVGGVCRVLDGVYTGMAPSPTSTRQSSASPPRNAFWDIAGPAWVPLVELLESFGRRLAAAMPGSRAGGAGDSGLMEATHGRSPLRLLFAASLLDRVGLGWTGLDWVGCWAGMG
jgi:hypothetical protein